MLGGGQADVGNLVKTVYKMKDCEKISCKLQFSERAKSFEDFRFLDVTANRLTHSSDSNTGVNTVECNTAGTEI